MNLKRALIALAAAGGVGAIAFGGSAVSTAFTSSSPIQYAEAQGATTGVTISNNGTFNAKGLLPGGAPVDVGNVVIGNSGTVAGVVTVVFQAFGVNANGSNGQPPNPNELIFHIQGLGNRTAAELAGKTFSLGTIGAGSSNSYDVTVRLDHSAGNEWQGGDGYLPYTVTITAGS